MTAKQNNNPYTQYDFYTSDLHFGHNNIIKYCNRPFDTADQMDDWITTHWNEKISTNDSICVVGDMTLCSTTSSLDYIKRLNGRITLIIGNHDNIFKKPNLTKAYIEAGISDIQTHIWLHHPEKDPVQINHFPYRSLDTNERYHCERPQDRKGWLIHGHVHDLYRQNGKQINVGIDAWGKILHNSEIPTQPQKLKTLEWDLN